MTYQLTIYLAGLGAYVPPKARTSTERDRRHELPHGSLVLEQQHRGARIARFMFISLGESEETRFIRETTAAAYVATASHTYGETDKVMRRRLDLPTMALGFNEAPFTESDLILRGIDQLGEVSQMARLLTNYHVMSDSRKNKLTQALGRTMGNTALNLNCISLANNLEGASPYMAQEMARISCLGLMRSVKRLSAELNCPPTLAQLPDPNSELSVYIRRNAPNATYEAYDEALSRYEMPR